MSLSSGTSFFGSAGSSLVAEVTSAKLSSGAIATLDGGPTTLVGTATSAIDFRRRHAEIDDGDVSGAGLSGTTLTPSTSTALPSLAESASWASAPDDSDNSAASVQALTIGR